MHFHDKSRPKLLQFQYDKEKKVLKTFVDHFPQQFSLNFPKVFL